MSLPDGPNSPRIWQMLHWITMPFSFMRGCNDRYGDRFTAALGEKLSPVVFFSNPQALQVILTNDDSELFDSPGELNAPFEPFVGTQSVFGLSGDRHRRMRQLLMPSFHGERMRSYGQLIRNITEEVMSQWVAGKPFSARKSMQRISMRVILRAVFGLKEGTRYQQLERLLGTMVDGMSNPLSVSLLYFPMLRQDFGPLSPWGSFVRARQQIDQLIYDEIGERRSHPDASRNDILTLLMSARDETGEALTDAELRDELMTLLLAGHETTATALTWALYWIHKFPTVRKQLLKELQALDGPLDPSVLFRLPYLNAVCCETLRIYPVGMLTFSRVTKSRVELMGSSLEPGTEVVGCIYLAHHREDVYPDPDEFRPERFLERRYSPFEYLPFGGGVRRCVGMAFAQFEMKLVISCILSGFELALADSRSVRPVRRALTAGPSPFRMVVKEHHPTKPVQTRQDSLINS
ncbi:MAG TPA: cytochrome P450 [Chthoniobacterales bacterium]|nr:cytochrome P450 [Chthoniobacterales bacterium]